MQPVDARLKYMQCSAARASMLAAHTCPPTSAAPATSSPPVALRKPLADIKADA